MLTLKALAAAVRTGVRRATSGAEQAGGADFP